MEIEGDIEKREEGGREGKTARRQPCADFRPRAAGVANEFPGLRVLSIASARGV